jgi:predicted CxxxxCH...CXXCH cytochrome family protein
MMWPYVAVADLQCYRCHGSIAAEDIRPVDSGFRNVTTGGFQGNHRTHMGARVSIEETSRCAVCHPGSDQYKARHRDGKIKLSSNINGSPVAAVYVNHTSTFRGWTSAFPQTTRPVLGTCSNVNCHFENMTPTWAAAPFASLDQCDRCHATPPPDGSHLRKHNTYFGTDAASCAKCHTDHRNDGNAFAHASSAGKRSLNVSFTTSLLYTTDAADE